MVISWSLRSPRVQHFRKQAVHFNRNQVFILLLIRFNSSCKVALWDPGIWALQDCLNKILITCFFSMLISMHFLCESMEGCWMLSCIAVHIPLSGQSVSTVPMLSSTHILVWRIGFGSSDKNFYSSKIGFFFTESFCRLKIFIRWQKECFSSGLKHSPGKWLPNFNVASLCKILKNVEQN